MDHPARRSRLTAAVLAATLAGLLTGCADAGHKTPPTQPTPPPVTGSPAPPASGQAGMAALPLAAYQDDQRTLRQQDGIRTSLAVSCMHRAGFGSFTADSYRSGVTPDGTTPALPAGAWGYLGPTAQGFHPKAATVAAPKVTDDSEAYASARVECDRQIADDFKPADQLGTELVDRLFAESLQAAEQDARVVTATRAWATCMTGAGYAATTPEALLQRYRTAPAPTAPELTAAQADATCTTRTDLAGLYFDVLAGYQRQQIALNTSALNDHQQALKDENAKLAKLTAP